MTAFYALIMAGGSGTRLWPRSRLLHPKQFLDIAGDLTMLQQSQQRIAAYVHHDKTLVATNQAYVDLVCKQLPQLPHRNILGEPVGRNTAPAIGLAAAHIYHRDPNAVMAVLTADHLIRDVDAFQRALLAAAEIAEQGWLVTLGITPSYPETGYGYIERAELLSRVNAFEVYQVARFVEKPDYEKAQAYIQSGCYAWNSGMFIWRVARILDEIANRLPTLWAGLQEIAASIDTPRYQDVLSQVFPTLPNMSIDYGIMETASKVAMLPVDIGWNDVGSWSAVYDVMPRDEANNAVVGQHIGYDTSGTLVYSPKRLVATLGLRDIVIVDTDDVLLVSARSRTQDVKKIVDALRDLGDSAYLQGRIAAPVLSAELAQSLWHDLTVPQRVLVSLLLHSGLRPDDVFALNGADFDLVYGWVMTRSGKKPLADPTREAVFAWMKLLNQTGIVFADYWPDRAALDAALVAIGPVGELALSVELLFETLARSLFEASEEGVIMRNMLGEEVAFVQAPLQNQFPFNIPDFSGLEGKLGEKARSVLNRAAQSMVL